MNIALKDKIKTAAGITAFIALVSFNPTHAYADPGDTGSSTGSSNTNANGGSLGTGSGGAKPEPIGTGSPDYSKPETKPTQMPGQSDADYKTEVGFWQSREYARQQAEKARKDAASRQNGNDRGICSTDPRSVNYCPVAGEDE